MDTNKHELREGADNHVRQKWDGLAVARMTREKFRGDSLDESADDPLLSA